MSGAQSILLFLLICLGALVSLAILAIMQRIALGIISLLARPTYLLLHASTQVHQKEFSIPSSGGKRFFSDLCGTIVSLGLFHVGFLVIQSVETKSIDFLTLLQLSVSPTEAFVILALFAIVCLLALPSNKTGVKTAAATQAEQNKWFEKMREIKFPPPFDWI